MRRSVIALGVVAWIALTSTGCDGGSAAPGRTSGTPGGGPVSAVTGQAPTLVVRETDALTFDPAAVTVPVGAVVEWRNVGVIPHNVVFDNGPRSELKTGGQTYEVRVGAPGTYRYECSIHLPQMVGTVTVTG